MSTETVPARALRDDGRGRWQRIRSALTPAEWRRAAGLAAVILGLHLVGFGLLFVVVVPQALRPRRLERASFGVGVGITAYTLGLRHAFDADHIGAIDNTTRKLMGDGQRPLSVGFFFSLGHSTIVFALAALFAVGIRGLTRRGRRRRLDPASGDGPDRARRSRACS